MDRMDRTILLRLEEGIPLTSRPFNDTAKHLRTTEKEIVSCLRRLLQSGVMRRFGASINHRKVGLTANAMVAWKVPQEQIQQIAEIMSRSVEVTHCYERRVVSGRWEYNLYTVIHARQRKAVRQLVKRLSEATGIKDYLVLFSSRELKKATLPAARLLRPRNRGDHMLESNVNLWEEKRA